MRTHVYTVLVILALAGFITVCAIYPIVIKVIMIGVLGLLACAAIYRMVWSAVDITIDVKPKATSTPVPAIELQIAAVDAALAEPTVFKYPPPPIKEEEEVKNKNRFDFIELS